MHKYMHQKDSPFNYGDNGGGANYRPLNLVYFAKEK